MTAKYEVYILYSPSADTFSIASTSDIAQATHYHNAGRGRQGRDKGPWYLVYSEAYEARGEAMARERQIKS